MQTDRGELHSPGDWFLIACNGDLVLKLAQDLSVGEDESGELILSPSNDEALLKIACVEEQLILQVLALDMTMSVAGDHSVQYLAVDSAERVRVRMPHNALSLTHDFLDGERDGRLATARGDFLDIALMRANQPAITTERMSVAPEVSDAGESLEEMIGPLTEVDVIDDEDHLRAARLQEAPATPEPGNPPVEPEEPELPPEIPAAKPPRTRRLFRVGAMIILGLIAAMISFRLAE
jgi:hypothetical protein